jgi:hypothetical protein
MIELIGNRYDFRKGGLEPEKSAANWRRRNEPSLIKKTDWKKLLQLQHPAVYRDDRKLFDHWLHHYKLLLRPKRIDYPMIRDRLEYALNLERKSLKQLERLVSNDSLFAAMSSQSILNAVIAANSRTAMKTHLSRKENLIDLYQLAFDLVRGGHRGAKGNKALSYLITSIDRIVRKRTGRSLSQSKTDVELVYVLANAVDGGPAKYAVKNKIAQMKKARKKADAVLSTD